MKDLANLALRAFDYLYDGLETAASHALRLILREGGDERPASAPVSTGGRKRAIEISVDLDSLAAWTKFHEANSYILDPVRFDILGRAILRKGCIEPLTRTRIGHGKLRGESSWREGLQYNGVGSRGRGVMHVIEGILKEGNVKWPKIYATEGFSPFAMRLRKLYPHFLGSEFTLDPEQQRQLYPIPCEDLLDLTLLSDSFDIVSTNEVLEHVPSIDRALHEICRVLHPGGWHVGTVPFHYFDAAATRRAVLSESGEVFHLLEPEYHVDPLNDNGALVFEIPGWDIIERAQQAGFSRAFMRFLISSRYGVLSEHIGGVFILCCQK
jgi:hypothetical protein